MPFFGGEPHHLPSPVPSMGRSATLSENFHAGLEEQFRVKSAFGLEQELVNRYNENLERIREFSGEDLSFEGYKTKIYGLDYMGVAARRALGAELTASGISLEDATEFLRQFDEKEARIAELKALNPEIQTFDEILEDVRQMRQEVMDRAADVGARSGLAGAVAGMAGAIVGSFSTRDPLLLGSLFFGGAGASIGRRVLAELGIGSAVEGGQQFGFVQPTHQMLGEDGGSPWLNIAAAGLGSAAFRGAFDSAVPTYRMVEERLFPQRALGRALNELIEGPMSLTRFDELMQGRMSNPTVRALRGVVEADEMLRTSNPYGTGVQAQRQFLAELEQTHAAFDGRSSTAIPRTYGDNLPAYAREIDFERALAEREFPVETARVVQAEERVAVADARIAAIENELERRTVADAVELIDPPSAERLRMIEQELRAPGAQVERLEAERDMIVESIGPDAIAKAENDWRIGPRRQLRDARRSRQAAVRERAKAQAAVDRRLAELRQQDADVSRVRELLGLEQVRAQPSALAAEASWRAPKDIRLVAERVEEAEPRLEEVGERIVERNVDEAEVDVDLPENIPADFHVPHPDNPEATIRAGDLMADLREDRAMVEAMRTCAI